MRARRELALAACVALLTMFVLYRHANVRVLETVTSVGEHYSFPLLRGSVNSLPGTTGPGVPNAMKNMLQEAAEVDEDAKDYYGSEKASKAIEKRCGWDPSTSNFHEATCFDEIGFKRENMSFRANPELMDIVTPSIRDLDFLNDWREFFQGFHIIIVQDADPNKFLNIPEWVDYELYNRNDIIRALGSDEWIISKRDASIRNFGFLVSKKPYIYTIDDDCLPARDSDGFFINPLNIHLRNLQTPSIPFFYNTLYDPYVNNSDFVRGYPYSLRNGVPTAVSHGLWLNAPDYDAPTQLLKPQERNTRYLDVSVTVPFGVMYPMCSMNVAFARTLIGPAFMQGLMGVGQPWGRYDDMFAGWASKIVADHINYGTKSGQPYIRHNKASNPFVNLRKEYMGIWWQEDIIRYMKDFKFPSNIKSALHAYRYLAMKLKDRFSGMHEYFDRLSRAMLIWTDLWEKSQSGEIEFIPSRRSNPDVGARFAPINLGERSRLPHRPGLQLKLTKEDEDLFLRLGITQNERIVTDEDIVLGHTFKTYMYPLGSKFNLDVLERYIETFNCITKTCSMQQMQFLPDHWTDYEAEVPILRKLLASLHFVQNPEEADVFLVPALTVTASNHRWISEDGSVKKVGCRNGGMCEDSWYKSLLSKLTHFSETSKPHIFLGSQDATENHPELTEIMRKKNSFAVTYGPEGIVVPSLNTAEHLQPQNWKQTAFEDRTTFVMAIFGYKGANGTDRHKIQEQLLAYTGTKKVTNKGGMDKDKIPLWLAEEGYLELRHSIFNICPAGHLPYQKRLFDTLLSGTIPVVIKRVNEKGESRHYEPPAALWRAKTEPYDTSVSASYPDIGTAWSEFLVELDAEVLNEENGIMKALESITEEEIRTKLAKIEKNRNLFLYDFSGTSSDAFSVMLKNIAKRLATQS